MQRAVFTFNSGPQSFDRYREALLQAIEAEPRTKLKRAKSPIIVIDVQADSPEAARPIAAELLDAADELIVKADDAKGGGTSISAIPAIHTEHHAIALEIERPEFG